MDKQQAMGLLPFVNSPDNQTAIAAYVELRIKWLHQQLETSNNMDQVKSIQGAIAELRRFQTLRDEVLRTAGKV